MKPTRLPPINGQNKKTKSSSKSGNVLSPKTKHLSSAQHQSAVENFRSLRSGKIDANCSQPQTSSSGGIHLLPSSSKKEKLNTSVPFLPETDNSTSSGMSNENFDDAISPPTPPNLSMKEENAERKALLKRSQIINGVSQSQAHSSRKSSAKRSDRVVICKSANDVRFKHRASDQAPTKSFVLFSFKQFRLEVEKWKKSKKANKLQEFFRAAFESFKSINDTFAKSRLKTAVRPQSDKSMARLPSYISCPQIHQKFVGLAYEILLELPKEVQKIVLKGIINCLLSEWKGVKSEVDLRAYFILLQNPMFNRVDAYVVYAHLLRQVATMNEKDQITLTHWFRRLSTPRFRLILEKLHQFVTVRLFPGNVDELPPMSNCGWWIPSAVKVLSLLNNANNLVKPRLVSFREFYNHSLDHIDVMAEFRQWESPASHSGLVSKLRILKRDQEREMIRSARDELMATIKKRPTRAPSVNQLFLNISVRRQYLLQDSMEQVYKNRKQLKKKLRVEFVGEPGYDMGGLTKEWFLLLLRKVLSPNYNTFVYYPSSRCYWFATNASENSSDLFLVGVLMGLAVYNCITLDISFPIVCYRKLLASINRPSPLSITHPADNPAPSSLPTTSKQPTAKLPPAPPTPAPSTHQLIGVVPVNLDDLKSLDPDLARGLQELLDYEGDVEEDFGMTYQLSHDDLGVTLTVPLKPRGDQIPVTNQNRAEYVRAVVNYKLNKSIYRQFLAFYHGFYTVCSSNALSFLCPEELEVLICGNNFFDFLDLKRFTTYQGFVANDPTIINFWDVLLSLSRDLQKKFLHFCTGSDRVPVGGLQELNLKIIRAPTAQNMLPMAHTCFNQLLLPPYGTRQQLESKLVIAISNAEGFGLE